VEAISMLDHAAIVEVMVHSCADARSDLAAALGDARRQWWVRNAHVRASFEAMNRQINQPQARELLDYYSHLQQSLRQEIDNLRRAGHTEYVSGCDRVLQDLTHGRLDYRPSSKASDTG
jgi:hypothetical protein